MSDPISLWGILVVLVPVRAPRNRGIYLQPICDPVIAP